MRVRRRNWIGDGSDNNPFRPGITALGNFSWVLKPDDTLFIPDNQASIKAAIRAHGTWRNEIVTEDG